MKIIRTNTKLILILSGGLALVFLLIVKNVEDFFLITICVLAIDRRTIINDDVMT